MKLPDLGATSPPALAPDIGPGMGQARDAALDAQAREGMELLTPKKVRQCDHDENL